MTSWPFVVMFIAPLSGSLTGRIHPGILGGLGLLMMSAGCFLLSHIPADAAPIDLGWRLALCGAGFGCRQRQRHALHRPPHRPGHRSRPHCPPLPPLQRPRPPRRHAHRRSPHRLLRHFLLPPPLCENFLSKYAVLVGAGLAGISLFSLYLHILLFHMRLRKTSDLQTADSRRVSVIWVFRGYRCLTT